MPQGYRDRRSRRSRILAQRNTERRTAGVCDVTLNHFANREVKAGSGGGGGGGDGGVARLKKESLHTAMKKLTIVKESDDRPWDEQDDDDEEGVIVRNGEDDDGGGGGGDGEKGMLCSKRDHKRRRRRVLEKTQEEEEEGLTDYPLDLWFLISEYIRPEDVGRFASLCQATRYITTTARFWLSMFRRHYQWTATLPDSLNYWNLDHRIKDVRVCVIRALFLMYAPFCVRIGAEKPLSADPTQLLRAQCILQWHRREGSQHKYFFKFAHPQHSGGRSGRVWQDGGGVSGLTNPHTGCWVLEATSVCVCAVPLVLGEYLYHAGVGVSANLCSHTLRLSLVPPHLLPPSLKAPTPRHRVPATEIRLDPVTNVRLYPWWHPQYWNLLTLPQHTNHKEHW